MDLFVLNINLNNNMQNESNEAGDCFSSEEGSPVQAICFPTFHFLRIHRCTTGDTWDIHTHFWQVHLFQFQYECITEKWFLPFYKRPEQKHNFICCLKYTGQLLLYISVNQGNVAER